MPLLPSRQLTWQAALSARPLHFHNSTSPVQVLLTLNIGRWFGGMLPGLSASPVTMSLQQPYLEASNRAGDKKQKGKWAVGSGHMSGDDDILSRHWLCQTKTGSTVLVCLARDFVFYVYFFFVCHFPFN